MTIASSDITVDTAVLREISAAVGVSDFAKAAGLADAAINRGLAHPVLFNARALLAQDSGRHEDALSDFQKAFAFTPRDVTLLNAIGLCLVRLNRADEAIAVFDSALKIAPAMAQTHYRKGWAHAANGDRDDARKCYERAVKLQPRHAEALGGLAWIAARSGDAQNARTFAERALALDARQPTASGSLAVVEIAEGDPDGAERRLRSLLAGANPDRSIAAVLEGILGDALDAQDRTDAAFAAYVSSNAQLRALNAGRFPDEGRVCRHASALADWLEEIQADKSSGAVLSAGDREPRQHVFLLGFMRSGTTLLEQALAAHPDITNLEERNTLSELALEFLSDRRSFARLLSLSKDDAETARALYWNRVRSFGIRAEGKVFIDKQPLATINLPLIVKLFPNAKILFALRDPRDVVFSCFRRHFEVGPASFELLDLEDAAHFYDVVMRLAETCRSRMACALFEHRYEDMVEDFDRRIGSICNFLGIESCDAMRRFGSQHHMIRSASAAQIRRGLYEEGIGHWRRYASHLAPILPMLRPWVERFGYAEE